MYPTFILKYYTFAITGKNLDGSCFFFFLKFYDTGNIKIQVHAVIKLVA